MELKANIGKDVLLPWLKGMRKMYEDKGLIPTLDLLIEDMQNEITDEHV